MVGRILSTLVVFQSVLILNGSCRKKETRTLPSYHIYENDTLPGDQQVTVFLTRGENKRFFYNSSSDNGALSLTLTACTSPISWYFTHDNTTTSILTTTMDTYHTPIAKALFTLHLRAVDHDTFAHLYVSTEPGGPQALQNAKFSEVRLLKRQKGKRLTVRWNPSLVDPQFTEYCLLVTPDSSPWTLCGAQLTPNSNTSISCVGRKTHHTLTDLKQGRKYQFHIFATNHQSNFTYPYGTTSAIFDGRFRHTSLKDGKATFANLKKLDGKAVFRYKVGPNSTKALDLFILPCGGVIDVEVTLKDNKVIPVKRIESYGRVTIDDPVPLARYYIKIFALNREELKKTSGVEVYATARFPAKIPLPSMPQTVKLIEYKSMTTCDSAMIGWMAVTGQKSVHYCLSAKEGKIRDMDEYRMPNQCGLENRLKKSVDFTVKFCTDVKHDETSVIVRKISQLKPGRFYIIQVTVKKTHGKTLSYDLLQVRTKPSCKKKH